MKFSLVLFFSFISTGLIACEDTDNSTCVYEKHGVRFIYEDKWYIEEESGWFSEPYVFLETDDSGLIMVLLLPNKDDKSLKDFAKEYSKTTNSQLILGGFKTMGFSDIIAITKHVGIEEKMILSIFDEEVPMTRQYFAVTKNDVTAYIIIQIDDEELSDISGVEKVLSTFEFIETKPGK